ncbi:MAG TPA: TIGR00341 family protein [Porphyromonadaceae bacterium]|nr:TIGR00341 family protein [Porphyromonadaceae bacterium]
MERFKVYFSIKEFLKRILDIHQEKDDERATIDSIYKGVEFRGANLWVLIFATFIASLGLNTNSTAVIIGAMLISPLMGPIMGFGLGLGINDIDLIKKSAKNYAIATLFSVLTSTIYFLLSPLSEAQSELLARTQPTIYDVLIALFGGLAGIVASSTKLKGNVIPGVAIATALMPPLCTAGFGLATGNFFYFFGAFYLYFINTVFISLSTLIVVRLLRFSKISLIDKVKEKRVARYIGVIVFFTIVPSLFLSYNMIRTSFLNSQVSVYVAKELDFPGTQIISKKVLFNGNDKELKVVLVGDKVPEMAIDVAQKKLKDYGLGNMTLVVQQGFSGPDTDINELKSMVLTDLYKSGEQTIQQKDQMIDSLQRSLESYRTVSELSFSLAPEMKVLFPSVQDVSINKSEIVNLNTQKADTLILVYLKIEGRMDQAQREKIKEWLSARTEVSNVKLIIE